MKIYIGPFKDWVGPYQLASLLRFVGFSEDRHRKVGAYLRETWVNDVCEYIYSKRKRTIKIKYHDYDTWNLDDTLAMIIAPGLKQLKVTQHGSPSHIDQLDVPEHMRCPPEKEDPFLGIPTEYLHPQWEWIMDEMIWAFEIAHLEDYHELSKEQAERQQKALNMFGKYYLSLWD